MCFFLIKVCRCYLLEISHSLFVVLNNLIWHNTSAASRFWGFTTVAFVPRWYKLWSYTRIRKSKNLISYCAKKLLNFGTIPMFFFYFRGHISHLLYNYTIMYNYLIISITVNLYVFPIDHFNNLICCNRKPIDAMIFCFVSFRRSRK